MSWHYYKKRVRINSSGQKYSIKGQSFQRQSRITPKLPHLEIWSLDIVVNRKILAGMYIVLTLRCEKRNVQHGLQLSL